MDEHSEPGTQRPEGEAYAPPEASPHGGAEPPAVPDPPAPPQPTPQQAPPPAAAAQHQAAPPPQPAAPPRPEAPPPVVEPPREKDRGRRTLGIVLIALGAVFLVNQFIAWDVFWPLILIAIGLVVLFRR